VRVFIFILYVVSLLSWKDSSQLTTGPLAHIEDDSIREILDRAWEYLGG